MTFRFAIAPHRGLLALDGPDSRTLLQGLISNDVMRVAPDRAVYAALLTAQGRYLHDFCIAELNGRLLVDCERERQADLTRRLTLYRLRAKVTFADANPDHAVVLAWGDGAAAGFGLDGELGTTRAWDGGAAFVDPRHPGLGVRAFLTSAGVAGLAAAGGVAGTLDDYDALRISLGVPDGSRDLKVEKALLLENGFEALHGVDFDKGCYVGQEITARTKYRGLAKKKLVTVGFAGAAPPPDTIIMQDGHEAGVMRSHADDRGLALLRLDALEKAAPLLAGETVIKVGG